MSDQQSNDIRSQVREAAKGIIQRAINDAAFAEQLRADPHTTVLEAGVPEAAVDDFITYDLGIEPDVSGYIGCYVTGCLWQTEEEEEEVQA